MRFLDWVLNILKPVTPPQPAPVPTPVPVPTPGPGVDFAGQLLALHNKARFAAGAMPMTLNPILEKTAQDYAVQMAKFNRLNHIGVDGTMPWDRGKANGYNWHNYGENIAAGARTPSEVFQEWMDDPPHKANIMNPKFKDVGFGYWTAANGNTYWCVDFGA